MKIRLIFDSYGCHIYLYNSISIDIDANVTMYNCINCRMQKGAGHFSTFRFKFFSYAYVRVYRVIACVCVCTFALNCLVICLRLRRSFHRSAHKWICCSVCFGFICLFICFVYLFAHSHSHSCVYVNMLLSLYFFSIYSIANCCKQQPYLYFN